jgi:hypothetical protein
VLPIVLLWQMAWAMEKAMEKVLEPELSFLNPTQEQSCLSTSS